MELCFARAVFFEGDLHFCADGFLLLFRGLGAGVGVHVRLLLV
jgi:hypothetical protein